MNLIKTLNKEDIDKEWLENELSRGNKHEQVRWANERRRIIDEDKEE